MSFQLCIHGHFYQPPRFDPWLEEILPEAGAAPFLNWNQRINRECYQPLAFARRMNAKGYIFNIINCYEHISFNFGPTVLSWMEKHSPQTYERILEGDRKSRDRLGHGNAMAQVYHHVIMPLSTDHDRDIEIRWSMADFEYRYGRKPHGMWLAEAAVCTQTLEALARAGIKFTVLAPRQAEAVSALDHEEWKDVDESTLETHCPYLIRLPSGNELAVFFYHGPLSQAVAFERLLQDGKGFWDRLLTAGDQTFINLATDGESYGHHFVFGEMALAYVLEQALDPGSPMRLTNYASHLENNPPTHMVRIRENSSWSCVHGIERWRDDCGCKDGGHPDWNQLWRRPLRRALNLVKYYIDQHYRTLGPRFFMDGQKALLDYGRCLCGAVSRDDFLAGHLLDGLGDMDRIKAMKLLEMQRSGLAGFASCAWFFDDIARIEPLNALSYALKGMELLKDLEGPDVEQEFLAVLEEAYSNQQDVGDGKKVWHDLVLPRKVNPEQMAGISLGLDELDNPVIFPGLKFELKSLNQQLELEFQWTKTGETGRVVFQSPAENKRDQSPDIPGNNSSVPGLNRLDQRLRHYILTRKDQRCENAAWQCILEQASLMPEKSIQPFEEGQKCPLTGIGILSPAIILMYLEAEAGCQDFEKYWKGIFRNNPFFREMVAKKITALLERLVQDPVFDWSRSADLASRSAQMGIHPDLFHVQNKLWMLASQGPDSAILEKFFLIKAESNEKS